MTFISAVRATRALQQVSLALFALRMQWSMNTARVVLKRWGRHVGDRGLGGVGWRLLSTSVRELGSSRIIARAVKIVPCPKHLIARESDDHYQLSE
jgi:hypothetical protein